MIKAGYNLINLNVIDILNDLGIEYKPIGQYNVRIKCINPNHIENIPSMSIHLASGICFCFGCSYKSNIYSFLKANGVTEKEVKPYLTKFLVGGSTEKERYNFLNTFINTRGKDPLLEELKQLDIPPYKIIENHPYLEQRGFTKKEIEEWLMGVVTEGKYIGWIIIPIFQNGLLRNYFMRSPFNAGKRYGESSRNNILAGLNFVPEGTKKIYVTEGIFDAIAFRKTRNYCVAALSNRLLRDQLQLLKDFKSVVIVPDNDEMGKQLIYSARSLVHNTNVTVCKLPPHRKDAADCTLEELLEASYTEIPIIDYILKEHESGIKTS